MTSRQGVRWQLQQCANSYSRWKWTTLPAAAGHTRTRIPKRMSMIDSHTNTHGIGIGIGPKNNYALLLKSFHSEITSLICHTQHLQSCPANNSRISSSTIHATHTCFPSTVIKSLTNPHMPHRSHSTGTSSHSEPEAESSRVFGILRQCAHIIFFAFQTVCVIFYVKFHLFDVIATKGPSMLPTIMENGEQTFTSKNVSNLKRGEVVVVRSPVDPTRLLCKRLYGFPGELIVNGNQTIVVPKGHIYLLGDNAANSFDSRHLGAIPLGLLYGRVEAIVYPRFQLVEASTDHFNKNRNG